MEYLQPQLNGVSGTLLDILTDFLKKQIKEWYSMEKFTRGQMLLQWFLKGLS